MDDPNALHSAALELLTAGRARAAVHLLDQALTQRARSPVILNTLALAREYTSDVVGAEAACREALAVQPTYGEAWHNLGNVLRKLGRPVEAAEAHEEAARLLPDVSVTHGAAGLALLDLGRLGDAVECFRRRAEVERTPASRSAVLFWRLNDHRVSEAEHLWDHLAWVETHCGTGDPPMFAEHGSRAGRPSHAGPLRVGYVSPDFREHTVAKFFEPLLAAHDSEAVTTVCYSDAVRPDDVTARLKSRAAEWRDTASLSDEQLAGLVHQDRIDVLVDLTGHAPGNRLLVFARRPAPVQVTYLCYPHTTGLRAIDYRMTDAISDPPGMTERYHVEQLVRLEGCAWCYQPDDRLPSPGESPAARNGYVTFGSLNRVAKITPPVAALWAKVLDVGRKSRLQVLAAGGEANAPVRRMLEAAGVPPDRLRLVPSGPRAQYLEQCRQADVGLDPFPYNGMTTTCDLLSLGVPTMTLAGTSHRARVGASLMTAVGLERFIATSEQEYVEIAARLAGDVDALADLRRGMPERLAASPLADGPGLARRVEAAYRQACAR